MVTIVPLASAWLGWFPTLFYTTTYISDLHARSLSEPISPDTEEEAIRLGARALFYSSVLALSANLILPYFVVSPDSSGASSSLRTPIRSRSKQWVKVPESLKIHLSSLWALSHVVFTACMLGTL